MGHMTHMETLTLVKLEIFLPKFSFCLVGIKGGHNNEVVLCIHTVRQTALFNFSVLQEVISEYNFRCAI